MRYLIICSLSLLSPYLALADETHIEQARQTLKIYGLGHCILKPFNERSALEKDIALSANAYSFMGNGLHSILQNEDTLQVLHDPYKETLSYISAAYEQTPSRSKHSNEKVVFLACLKIYNSEAFKRFIKTQDAYISDCPPDFNQSKDRSLRRLLHGIGAHSAEGCGLSIFRRASCASACR